MTPVGKRTIVDIEQEARAPYECTRIARRLAFGSTGIEFVDEIGAVDDARSDQKSATEISETIQQRIIAWRHSDTGN